jgi:hypothetical protein
MLNHYFRSLPVSQVELSGMRARDVVQHYSTRLRFVWSLLCLFGYNLLHG